MKTRWSLLVGPGLLALAIALLPVTPTRAQMDPMMGPHLDQLTGDEFDSAEALRLGLVQEIVPAGQQFERALAYAERVAEQAPLAVQAQPPHAGFFPFNKFSSLPLLIEASRAAQFETGGNDIADCRSRLAGNFRP